MIIMSTNQNQPKEKFNRNSELRIRGVSKDVKKELAELQALMRLPFESNVVVRLITRYRDDQAKLSTLNRQRYELEAKVAKLQEREDAVKKLLTVFAVNTNKFNRMVMLESKKLLKQFSGTVKARKPGAAGQVQRKSVPHRKAAKKKG